MKKIFKTARSCSGLFLHIYQRDFYKKVLRNFVKLEKGMGIDVKKIVRLFLVIFVVCFAIQENVLGEQQKGLMTEEVVPATSQSIQQELPPLSLYAQGAVLMDATSGRVLYSKNGEEQMPMASTTKIMTLILTLERANLEDVVTVSAYAASMPDVQLNIREGEQYRLKDLLYSLMLESHNDSAVAIAEHVGGSVEEFAALMNQKAQEIGCENTWFITPNGLDATAEYTNKNGEKETRTHGTTAKDLAKIMSYCITESPCKDEFLEITRTSSYSFSDLEGKRTFGCTNHNAFLGIMEGALSGKTGFTSKAGYCYVGALKRDERVYVVALLACGWPNNKTYKWSDTKKLMEYGLTYYTQHELANVQIPQDVYEPIPVMLAQTEKIGDTAHVSVDMEKTKDEQVESILLNANENIIITFEKADNLQAPVEAGEKVGELHYMVGEEEWRTVRLVTTEEIKKIDWKWSLKQVLNYWML